MRQSRKKISWRLIVSGVLLGFASVLGWPQQQYTRVDRELAEAMLRDVAADVQKHYYDTKLHGLNWDVRVQEAKKNIDAAHSLNIAMSEIDALLNSLKDSHTYFIPPPVTHVHDYGFQMEMIGDRCYVIRVRSGSDAEKKGLKPGDEILAVNENPVSRENFWRIIYIFDLLRPQLALRLTLVDQARHQQQLEVMASFRLSTLLQYSLPQGVNQRRRDFDDAAHLMRARYFEKGDALLVVKIPEFAYTDSGTESIIEKMRAHKSVILDLRGNTGGYVDTLDHLLGGMFENDVKVCDRVERDSTKSVSVTGRHNGAFTGRFVVLLDSESGSASEVFARVIQLEKRGNIVGDRSSGRVMEARHYPHLVSATSRFSYGASVTVADLLMTDGKALEHVGVEPDVVVLPMAQDLANRRDPAMAKAGELVGVPLSSEEAGSILPYEESERLDVAH
jgi:C-terminal processing protease CtpA/Prc